MQFVVKTWWKITFAISKTKYGPYISFKDDYVKKKWANKYPFKCMIYWWGFQKTNWRWIMIFREIFAQRAQNADAKSFWPTSSSVGSSQRTCVFLQMLMGEWHASNIKWWTLARVVLLLKRIYFLADYKRSQRLDGHELLSSVGWRCNTVFIL